MRRVPRYPLAALPTPLVRAERLERAAGASSPIWVKRDDLTGFALGGNKARKLELTVADALARGADVLLTGGGVQSNHCRTAAAAARVAGLGCRLLLYGTEPPTVPANLRLIRRLGAEVRFTGDPDRRSVDEALERERAELGAAGARPYPVPRGGATGLGAAAYALAARELGEQLDRQGVERALVLVAAGSGATQAGLLAGAAAEGRPWRVVGASCSRPPEVCRERVLRLGREAADLLGTEPPPSRGVEVVDARGPGYGVASEAGGEAARLSWAAEGLLLDPVFTAKAMAALLDLLAGGEDGPAVFVHTGGVVTAIEEASHG